MNIFKKNVIMIEDPVFGTITFKHGIWEFIPRAQTSKFMVTIAAPVGGPTDVQREFFRQISSNIIKLQDESKIFMKTNIGESIDMLKLSIYSIEIGTDEDCRHARFAIEFSDDEATIIHHISFVGGQPVDYGVED